jgi:hypothetical protein
MNLNEIKAMSISVGDTYTLAGDLGKFKQGETVEILKVRPTNNPDELQIIMYNGKVKDDFYISKDDDYEELT